MAATGLVSYAYFALASHSLAAADYGRIALLWSAVFITVSILYRPVEQLVARTIADRSARGVPVTSGLRAAAAIQVVLAVVFLAAALLLRDPLEDGLFDGSATLYWVMIATVLAYAGSYFGRGVLAARGRFRGYGGLLLVESCTRVTFALAVAVGLASGASVVALGMAVGPAVSLALVLALSARSGALSGSGVASDSRSLARTASVTGGARRVDERDLALSRGAGYAGGALVIVASEQAFLNVGPLLLSVTEGAAGAALAGFAFNALLIARAPLQLFQAVQASILPYLTRLSARGRADPFHRGVALTLLAVGGFAALVTGALLGVGPPVMELLFGGGFDYGRGELAVMGVAMGLYLGAATLTQAALARGEARAAAVRWLLATATFVALLLVPGWEEPVLGVELAFAGGALALFALLAELYRRGEKLAAGP